MKYFLFSLFFLIITNCSKPKTVLICGDHICINKAEAEQYFEDNLTLEVRIIDTNEPEKVNLVELNLESKTENKRKISILNKETTNKKLKKLSNIQIKEKKAELKKRKIVDKKTKKTKVIKQVKLNKSEQKLKNPIKKTTEKTANNKKKSVDICAIIEKCSIDEISKFLVKQGNIKKFPDITNRENK